MQDIGMSPDYRSGVHETGTCSMCDRTVGIMYLETCCECGTVVCCDCLWDEGKAGAVCLCCAEMPVLEL